jgi:hypothetical protein
MYFGAFDDLYSTVNFFCMESGLMKMTNIMHKQTSNCMLVRTS